MGDTAVGFMMAGLGPVERGGAGEEALELLPPPMPRDPPPPPTPPTPPTPPMPIAPPTGVTDLAPSRCGDPRSRPPSRLPFSVSSGESGPLWELAD